MRLGFLGQDTNGFNGLSLGPLDGCDSIPEGSCIGEGGSVGGDLEEGSVGKGVFLASVTAEVGTGENSYPAQAFRGI